MIKDDILKRILRLKLTTNDKFNLCNLLKDKYGKQKELINISKKLSYNFSSLIIEYLGEEYMNNFRKIKRISKTGKYLRVYLYNTDKIPLKLPDDEDKIKIPWYENYKLIKDRKSPILSVSRPVINLELDEDFPYRIFIDEKKYIELGSADTLSSYTIEDIEVFNINEKTNELINKIYYLYLEYFKFYFVDRNILKDIIPGVSTSYSYFFNDIPTWKKLYNIKHEWVEILYDYYTIGNGTKNNNNIRFEYLDENSKDKVDELMKYILE